MTACSEGKTKEKEEDNFMLAFAKVLLAFIILFILWTGLFLIKEIDYVNNGTPVTAKVIANDGTPTFFFVIDRHRYYGRVSGMLYGFSDNNGFTYIKEIFGADVPKHGDQITVYYKDDPSTALVPTRPYHYVVSYSIAFAAMGLVIWWMKLLKKHTDYTPSIEKETDI